MADMDQTPCSKTEYELRMWCVDKAINAGATTENVKDISEKIYSFINPPPPQSSPEKITDPVARAKAGFVDDIPRVGWMPFEMAKVLRECIRMDKAGQKINQQAIAKELKTNAPNIARLIDSLHEKKFLEKQENFRTIKILMDPTGQKYMCQQTFVVNQRVSEALRGRKKNKGRVVFNGAETSKFKLKDVANTNDLAALRKRMKDLGMEGMYKNAGASQLKDVIAKRERQLSLSPGEQLFAAE